MGNKVKEEPAMETAPNAAKAMREQIAAAMGTVQGTVAAALQAAKGITTANHKAALDTIAKSNENVAVVLAKLKAALPSSMDEAGALLETTNKDAISALEVQSKIGATNFRAAQESIQKAIETTSRVVAEATQITSVSETKEKPKDTKPK
jgi:hypothetical protein